MLNSEEAKARAAANEAMEQSKIPTIQEQIALQRAQEFFNWERSNDKDIRTLPGMSSYLQIGQMAQRKAAADRYGTGAFQLASGANEQYATQLRAMQSQEMAQNIGAGLEGALAERRAEAVGGLLPFGQMGLQRQLGRLGAAQQREGAYLSAPRETPFWQQLTLAAIGGGASVLGAHMMRPAGGSDARWKTEIEEIPYGLSEVVKMRSVKYTMRDEYKDIGFIAQEMEDIIPEIVFYDEEGYRYLDYAKLTSVLVKAVQELKKELDDLKGVD